MRKRATLALFGAGLGLLVAGCGGSPSVGPADGSSSSPPAAPSAAVQVTVKGDKVTPNGRRIEASVGEPVTVVVTSDRAGALHGHSEPEQNLPFTTGRATVQITIDRPGLVDVEEHQADRVVLQLRVS